MLSPRVWLERFPLQLRFFVAFLTALSFVAPTWHVCSMGGHTMPMTGAHGKMTHGATGARTFQRSASGAIICFCAPTNRNHKFPVPPAAVVNGRMTHDASCLALLLAAMPALSVAPFNNAPVSHVSFAVWSPTHRDFPVRELIRTFSGRGPPR